MGIKNKAIDVLAEQIIGAASACLENASFDRSISGRILAVLDDNKYTVRLSDGTERSVLSLTSDSFVVNDVVIISVVQNDAKNSYIIGKPGIQRISPSGYGDMAKGVYDINNNGVVDNAEKVNGHTVLSNVPADAVFTDTTYVDATTTVHGLLSISDKTKLDGIAFGAEKNVNADWNETDGSAQILNKPTVFPPSAHTHSKTEITDFPTIPDQISDLADDPTHRVVTDVEKSTWNSKQSVLSGDVAGHYHSKDRNRANHTGTQTASTISDFSSAALSAAPAETVSSIGTLVHDSTAKTSPVDADMIPLMDSVDNNKIKKLSWAYVKSALISYFGSIFASISHTHTISQITDMPVSLPANGGNSETVNNHTINKDVPANAVFTDTTYSDATASVHGLMSSADKTKLDGIAAGAEKNVNADFNATSGDAQILNLPSTFPPSVHTHTLSGITDITATAKELNTLDGITASTIELNYTDGVTSNIQTQLNSKLPSTSYTASDVLTKLKTVDGAGSGLDADLLDNQEGSYYLSFTNATNKPSPVITLSGDASGSATLTNMGSATLNVIVADDSHNHIISNVDGLQSALDSKTNSSLLGAANGVAQLDANGFVPASQLPSYVDDILEYNGIVNFPATGESGKIYVDTLTNLTYRWSGSSYTEISKSLALGETSSTAYAGDKGKAVADGLASHKNNVSNPHGVTASQVGLGAFETTATNIKMNGTQSVGTLSTVARSDHVHPIDTSRAAASHTHTESNITNLTTDLAAKAPLASPAFTGVPTAPTASSGTNTTQLATTAFVQGALSAGGYGDMLKSVYDTNGNGKVDNAENSDTVGGFSVGAATNNSVNSIVRTDNSGYLNCSWLRSTSGVLTGKPHGVWVENGNWLYYQTTDDFINNCGIATKEYADAVCSSYIIDNTTYHSCIQMINGKPQMKFEEVPN